MCAWDQWDQIDYFHTVIVYIFSLNSSPKGIFQF